jgi:hypothetical protein
LPTTEILQTDVLGSVVVGVVLIPALLTLERLPVTVIVVGKPTRRAPLRRVTRVNLYGLDTVFFGLVFDVLGEASERPDVLPRRFGNVLPKVGQILEYDVRTVVLDGFLDEFVRHCVQVYLEASVLFVPD